MEDFIYYEMLKGNRQWDEQYISSLNADVKEATEKTYIEVISRG